MKKTVVIILALMLPLFLAARPEKKWNNWTDRQSVLDNIENASKEGRTYFSMFKFYNYTKTDDIEKSKARDFGHPFMYGIDFYQATGDYLPKEMTETQYHNISVTVKDAWKNNKAIPLVSWHLHCPYAVYSDFNKIMGCRYQHLVDGYPQEHRYVINEILNNKQVDTLGINRIGDWFDAQVREIADFINNEFIDDNGNPIPFVFRLWHEQTDAWQWWGIARDDKRSHVSAEDYKAFWRLTVEKFQKYCPKAEILWCYCPNRYFKTEEQYLLSYPGDDIVDILAYDDYQIGDTKNLKSVEELRKVVLKRARLVSGIASRLNKPLMIAESNCRKEELKDIYFDIMQEILTDKDVHISIVQLWSKSYYKNQTIEFVQNNNIIFNK